VDVFHVEWLNVEPVEYVEEPWSFDETALDVEWIEPSPSLDELTTSARGSIADGSAKVSLEAGTITVMLDVEVPFTIRLYTYFGTFTTMTLTSVSSDQMRLISHTWMHARSKTQQHTENRVYAPHVST